MKYLLDAHALLWHRAGDERLPAAVRNLLAAEEAQLWISDATFWELTIKHTLGKLSMEGGVDSLYREWIVQGVANRLPIEWPHFKRLGSLPLRHRDPFDRLLIAQALCGNLILVTGDCQIHGYPELQVFWQ